VASDRGRPRCRLPGLGGRLAFALDVADLTALLRSLTPVFRLPSKTAAGSLNGRKLLTEQYSWIGPSTGSTLLVLTQAQPLVADFSQQTSPSRTTGIPTGARFPKQHLSTSSCLACSFASRRSVTSGHQISAGSEFAESPMKQTEDGRKLALLTQAYFRSVEEMRASSAKDEAIRIGAGESVFRWLVMPRLVELQNLAATVRLEFLTKTTAQSVESVKAGQLDLAIVRKEAADDSLTALPCGSLAYALVVPRKLLPSRTAAGFQLLQKVPFALLAGDGVLAKGVLALAAKVDVKLDIRVKLWEQNDLRPHQTRTFKLSNDPQFEAKFWDVIGLYLNPPTKAVVLCCDEKSQCQALERTQPGLPLGQGQICTRTHDYYRHGTLTLFAALDYLEGKIIAQSAPRHRHQEWLAFLKQIEQEVPVGQDIHLIVDNYATHKHPSVKRWLKKHPRVHLHFTPTSSSWLNLVERFFRDLSQDVISPGSFRSVPELKRAIFNYLAERNDSPKRYVWRAEGEKILAKIQRAREALARQTG
jgi:transposase